MDGSAFPEEARMRLGMAVLRVVVGVLLMGHGLQKLVGWFGGSGLDGTARFFEKVGLRPGRAQAALAGGAEAGGGALLALGLLTPVGAAMVTGSMAGAIAKVHAPNGPWVSDGGYEYNLVLMAAVFAIAAAGPGRWSLDERLGIARSGAGVGLAELAVGLAGAAAAVSLGSRVGEAPDPQAENGGGPA
jgi:putative oxidoreductase